AVGAGMAEATLVEIQMPQMGESVTEGTVLEWHVSEGDSVAEGDTVVEVSTDKVDAEVPAPASGTIAKILAGVDETVRIGQALAQIDTNGGGSAENGTQTAEQATSSEQQTGNGEAPGLREEATGEGDQDLGGGTTTEEQRESPAPTGEAVEIVMPEMGESVTEGTVLEWH